MPRTSTSRFRSRGATRRKTSWQVGPTTNGIETLTATGSLLVNLQSQVATDGLTLVRIRGQWDLFLEASAAVAQGYHGAIGLCFVSENAGGIGITAVPTPITDEAWDGWVWHHYFSLFRGLDPGANGSGMIQIPIDSKSMRKEKATDLLVAVIQATEIGTAILDFSMRTRILVKLA